MHGQPAGCMRAKSSLTTAYPKLGCSYTDKVSPIYMSVKLSKLMLNPLYTNPCRVNLRHAVGMPSLYVYFNLYGADKQATKLSTALALQFRTSF